MGAEVAMGAEVEAAEAEAAGGAAVAAAGVAALAAPEAARAERPDWADSLMEWVGKAADRSVYLRGSPYATDETGRRWGHSGSHALHKHSIHRALCPTLTY
jgi:hypothetical protein